MKSIRIILSLVCSMTLMAACSNSDADDWNKDVSDADDWSKDMSVKAESGVTRTAFGTDDIPVRLVDITELPEWMQKGVQGWSERDALLGRYKIFQGKLKGETIYYFDDILSSCIGCLYYHDDGRQIEYDEWEKQDGVIYLDATDWTCIYSAAPLLTGLTGTLHYDPNRENRNDYMENGQKRYYIWGYLNTDDLKKYDGKHVVLSGFMYGDITQVINDCPSGVTCYGIEATYINGE